ncbi:Hydroxyacyl-thioester dehydratase type 2, mitochondrial [Golovinomyces cichoracearum]|uniref:Hydroxyacyl-thioester dehydratase type 2, mitochondrial n=1 Tax=Golovinomyces cichoracearum TaxID=62708 RepID=A0A420JB14_9PEZI|nr:Hydroxyacyl-thioester dehydratase type 2, mitochondrial [Golovinomyces cichoracearum]
MRPATHSFKCRGLCMIQKGGSRFYARKRGRNRTEEESLLYSDGAINDKASSTIFRTNSDLRNIYSAPSACDKHVDTVLSDNRLSGNYEARKRKNLVWINENKKLSDSILVNTNTHPLKKKKAPSRRNSVSSEHTLEKDSAMGEAQHEQALSNLDEDSVHLQQTDTKTNSLEMLEKTLREKLFARPEIIYYDHMAPTPSQLLKISLQSDLPFMKSCLDIKQRSKGKFYLPAGHHFVYFNQQVPTGSLLPDGTDDLHSPGHPYERRLWVGGSIEFTKTFTLFPKIQMICLEKITDVRVTGIHGNEKVFVEITRRIINPYLNSVKLKEVRTLIFMRRSDSREIIERTNIPKPRAKPCHSLIVRPTRALLFRFSALTFNAHRIHLDSFYCRQVEGLKSMIVHGPLTVVFMLTFLTEKLHKRARIDSFSYRNITPLYVEEDMKICVRKGEKIDHKSTWHVWIEGPTGGYAVKATAKISWVGEKVDNKESLEDNKPKTISNCGTPP